MTYKLLLVVVMVLGLVTAVLLWKQLSDSRRGRAELPTSETQVDIYDKDAPSNVGCSSAQDNVCPQWCAPGSDYDCCVRKGNYRWIEGRGCYSK